MKGKEALNKKVRGTNQNGKGARVKVLKNETIRDKKGIRITRDVKVHL